MIATGRSKETVLEASEEVELEAAAWRAEVESFLSTVAA